MNLRRGREKFKNFRILLGGGYIYTNVMGRLVEKLGPEKDAVMQWQKQARNITTTLTVNVDFTVPILT